MTGSGVMNQKGTQPGSHVTIQLIYSKTQEYKFYMKLYSPKAWSYQARGTKEPEMKMRTCIFH